MSRDLGEIIKSRRIEIGPTQREVAEKALMSRTGYCNIEQGRVIKPTRSILESICDALDLPFEEVIRDAGLVYAPVKSN